jgi:hypothetical protein
MERCTAADFAAKKASCLHLKEFEQGNTGLLQDVRCRPAESVTSNCNSDWIYVCTVRYGP